MAKTEKDDKSKGKKTAKAKSSLSDTQQVSDKLAKKVASGQMSYRQASKIQRKNDSVALGKKTISKVTRTSSQGLPTKRKTVAAKHKRGKDGNIKRY